MGLILLQLYSGLPTSPYGEQDIESMTLSLLVMDPMLNAEQYRSRSTLFYDLMGKVRVLLKPRRRDPKLITHVF